MVYYRRRIGKTMLYYSKYDFAKILIKTHFIITFSIFICYYFVF